MAALITRAIPLVSGAAFRLEWFATAAVGTFVASYLPP